MTSEKLEQGTLIAFDNHGVYAARVIEDCGPLGLTVYLFASGANIVIARSTITRTYEESEAERENCDDDDGFFEACRVYDNTKAHEQNVTAVLRGGLLAIGTVVRLTDGTLGRVLESDYGYTAVHTERGEPVREVPRRLALPASQDDVDRYLETHDDEAFWTEYNFLGEDENEDAETDCPCLICKSVGR